MTRVGPVVLALAALTAGACGGNDGGTTLTVYAASSLTDAFRAIADGFEEARPGVDVALNFAGSTTLAQLLNAGAPAGVFASADQESMERVRQDRGVALGGPYDFARNGLAIGVPAGNPAGVERLADLADPDLLVGLCAAEVPCGRFAREALARAGVEASIDTNEPDVRALLTRIAAGELDAGIVYVTDAAALGADVDAVPIPAAYDVEATYSIAVVADAPHPETADDFVAFVRSEHGRRILRRLGFRV